MKTEKNFFEQTQEEETIAKTEKQAGKEQPKENLPQKQSPPPALPKKLLDAGFGQILLSPKRAFLNSGGTEQQFNREVNFAVQLLMNNDYLFNCAVSHPDHFIESIKNISLTGLTLNPELRLAYLVPYKGKVKFQSSYMGKVDILMRTGVVKWIEANLVYERDTFFASKGTEAKIFHQPDYFSKERGEIKGGYWVAELPNGKKAFDVMPLSRIMEIRQRSEAVKAGKGSPWDTDPTEMMRKTILNWGYKSLPKSGLSEDLIRVLEIENDYERDEFEEWKKEQEKPAKDTFDEDGITNAEVVE